MDVEFEIEPKAQKVQIKRKRQKQGYLSKRQIEKAVDNLGLVRLNATRIKAQSAAGDLVREIGATKLAGGILMIAQDRIEDGIAKCDEKLADAIGYEDWVEISKIRTALTHQLVDTAKTHIMSDKWRPRDEGGPVGPVPCFPAGSSGMVITGPVQINCGAKDDHKG